MQKESIAQAEEALFKEANGSTFSKLKDKLIKIYAVNERELVIDIFMRYIKEGQLTHWRSFLLPDLIKLVFADEDKYAAFFKWSITVPELTYWGIGGLIKTIGKTSYDSIIQLIQNKDLELESRAKAAKSIAQLSGQPFDRSLPSDPGYWKEEDLRLAEILEWQQNNYDTDIGYVKPNTNPVLNNPKTDLEIAVAKLDKKLEKERIKKQDLANPGNWLVVAEEADLSSIQNKWALPEMYFLFLKNYSPLYVFIVEKKFTEGLSLYGASNLIKNQEGYSINSLTKQVITDWPQNMVVIGDAGADPFCIDVNAGNDAPVYTSTHGTGKWVFELYANSFLEFIRILSR